jgi:TatD family-associated radical SAM protein
MSLKIPSVVYWLDNKLYLNITNKCSNNCSFCFRNFRDGVGGFNLKLRKEPSAVEVVSQLQERINKSWWKEIVFCGLGEPTERLDCLLEVTKWIKRNHGKNMTTRIDTNGQGYLLNQGRDVVKELKEAGINRISISLNAQDEKTYTRVCRPKFPNAYKSVLEFIERSKRHFDVEVTAVTIPTIDLPKIRKIAQQLGVSFREREYIPSFR